MTQLCMNYVIYVFYSKGYEKVLLIIACVKDMDEMPHVFWVKNVGLNTRHEFVIEVSCIKLIRYIKFLHKSMQIDECICPQTIFFNYENLMPINVFWSIYMQKDVDLTNTETVYSFMYNLWLISQRGFKYFDVYRNIVIFAPRSCNFFSAIQLFLLPTFFSPCNYIGLMFRVLIE